MPQATFTIPVTATVNIEGGSMIIKVLESVLTVKIEGLAAGSGKRLQLGRGRTMFDLILNAAKAHIEDTGENEFSAADLYHMVINNHPALDIKRNSWGSHMVASAPNHPSYKHYTSRRKYLRYLGGGRYSLNEKINVKESGLGEPHDDASNMPQNARRLDDGK